MVIRPSVGNAGAIKAYMNAGFVAADKSPGAYLLGEYLQCVVTKTKKQS